MEAEHSETIVDKAVAYVKDMLGMPPADRPPDVVANPEHTDTAPELTSATVRNVYASRSS